LKIVHERAIAVKFFRCLFRFINNALDCIHFSIQHASDRGDDIRNQHRAILLLDLRIQRFVALCFGENCKCMKTTLNSRIIVLLTHRFDLVRFGHALRQVPQFIAKSLGPLVDAGEK
jgi:hypothetical protein